jgi:Ni/Fe-hydrogenase subunit HybB-like protein
MEHHLVVPHWNWNPHSPLLEVMFWMPAYAMLPLMMENPPPVLEHFHRYKPNTRAFVEKCEKVMIRFYPFIVALAYMLPAMHQSSLGALMLLGGDRVPVRMILIHPRSAKCCCARSSPALAPPTLCWSE